MISKTKASGNYSSQKARLINEEKFGPYTFPFSAKLSFEPLIKFWEKKGKSEDMGEAVFAREIHRRLNDAPSLQEPIEDIRILDKHDELVELLLAGMFPSAFREQQLGFAIPPFLLKGFYFTPRLTELLLSQEIRFGFGANPILTKAVSIARACAAILNKYYGQKIVIDPPFNFVMRPKNQVVERYYKSQLNSDFVVVKQLKPLPEISQGQINRLLGNIYDTKAWLEVVPPTHFEFEGLVFAHLIDVTEEEAVSRIKHRLLENDALLDPGSINELQLLARNYFDIHDLKLGVKAFDYPFKKEISGKYQIDHNILSRSGSDILSEDHSSSVYMKLCRENTIVIVEDLTLYHDPTEIEVDLLNYGIRSMILAPLNDDNGSIIGFIELGSGTPNGLNALSLIKMSELIPLFEIAVKRSREEIKNRIQAIIRENYTHIHPSVEWKFIQTSFQYLELEEKGDIPSIKPILFRHVYPLFGEADVVNSSVYRNNAIREDYLENLELISKVFKTCAKEMDFPIINHYQYEIKRYRDKLNKGITSSDEVRVLNFIRNEIHKILQQIKENTPRLEKVLDTYFGKLDPEYQIVYKQRLAYEESIFQINEVISNILEKEDERAQNMIPHYFEKHKTDGLEFDIYVGQSILREGTFTDIHLKNLRLWQITTLCEITRAVRSLKASLSCPMETAQLILVYSNAINIRFRTDEKRFDLDDDHNVDYEIIKKRVDKANIAGSEERIRKPGHITIVYTQDSDRAEYLDYLRFLIKNKFVDPDIEHLNVQKLQGVEGLKAIRVQVLD